MEISGQYLTYVEYKGLGGTLDLMPFKLLEFNARQIIDKYTFGRLKDLETQNEEVKLCVFNLIGKIDSFNQIIEQNKGVSSENIDGYSVTYSSIDKAKLEAENNGLGDVVRTYLIDCKLDDGTPYLYCGAE